SLQRQLGQNESERRRIAGELNRRLSELFSLQELSYVLSESLELDRIVEQVLRYAMRFLDARGALLALASDPPDAGGPGRGVLTISGADGTLAHLRGDTIPLDDAGVVVASLSRDRLEIVHGDADTPAILFGAIQTTAAAAVPLRAHGVVIGSLAVAEPRSGAFPPEDMRLLSTVATHSAVVLANARFFEIVRHAKEQWETAFDALSEGIAVVGEDGRVRRATRALASLLGIPLADVVGGELGTELLGNSPAL